jgi:hypothetical protein
MTSYERVIGYFVGTTRREDAAIRQNVSSIRNGKGFANVVISDQNAHPSLA